MNQEAKEPRSTVEVESIVLAPELERKLGEATVRVGDFRIKEITIWRHSNGAIDVYLPSTRGRRYGGRLTPYEFHNIVEVPKDLYAEIKTIVKAAFKARKELVKKDV